MRDIQEQVQAISERSLTLGERSQKIGEVLELINDIAEQTNLSALNAARSTWATSPPPARSD